MIMSFQDEEESSPKQIFKSRFLVVAMVELVRIVVLFNEKIELVLSAPRSGLAAKFGIDTGGRNLMESSSVIFVLGK